MGLVSGSAGGDVNIKESDVRRYGSWSGGYELWEFFLKSVFLFVSMEVRERGKGT